MKKEAPSSLASLGRELFSTLSGSRENTIVT